MAFSDQTTFQIWDKIGNLNRLRITAYLTEKRREVRLNVALIYPGDNYQGHLLLTEQDVRDLLAFVQAVKNADDAPLDANCIPTPTPGTVVINGNPVPTGAIQGADGKVRFDFTAPGGCVALGEGERWHALPATGTVWFPPTQLTKEQQAEVDADKAKGKPYAGEPCP
jgi:hypothetical protein